MTELLAAVIGTLLGVALTHLFDTRQAARQRAEVAVAEAAERQRARESTATALLFDLKRLEFDLRQMYAAPRPSLAVTYEAKLFYGLLQGELRWFAPESIQPVAEFFRRVEHYYLGLAAYRALTRKTDATTPQQEYNFRCQAAFALQMVPNAAAALLAEGGVAPRTVDWTQYTYPNLPDIPAAVFSDIVVDMPALDSRQPLGTVEI